MSPGPFTPTELATLRQAAEERAQMAEDLTCRLCHQTPVRAPGDGCAACVEELLTVSTDLETELQAEKRRHP